MSTHRLRILHLSDLHERVALDRTPAERKQLIQDQAASRERVLGQASSLWRILANIRAEHKVDWVCFTGDIADSGLPEEFAAATPWVARMLDTVGVTRDRLFLIPGNHDVQQKVGATEWETIRNLVGSHTTELSRWIRGGDAPLGVQDSWRDALLQRTAAFWSWVEHDLGRAILHPRQGPHGRLGYRVTLKAKDLDLPFDVHLIGLDSAWLCGKGRDHESLLLTNPQLDRLTTDHEGKPLSGFRLAMVHHPLDMLADAGRARQILANNIDLVLRGHQHKPIAQKTTDPDRSLLELAAGCLFEGTEADEWRNGFHVLDVYLDDNGQPIRYEVSFWRWSPDGLFWYPGSDIYENAPNGRLVWERRVDGRWDTVDPAKRASTSPPPRPPDPKPVFVGREKELQTLAETLLTEGDTPRRAIICGALGMAGVGKTWLVEHFYTSHPTAFPGGFIALVLDPGQTVTVDTLLGRLADRLDVRGEAKALAESVSVAVAAQRPLIHVENVDDRRLAEVATQLARRLAGGRLVITGRYTAFTPVSGWRILHLQPFGLTEGADQLAQELTEARDRIPAADRDRLVGALGGLPLAIHLAAGYLNHGYTVDTLLTTLQREGLNVEPFGVNDPAYAQRAERTLAAILDRSLDLFKTSYGRQGKTRLTALCNLGIAPRVGVGLNLAAAIAGLDDADTMELLTRATSFSLVMRVPSNERPDGAWRVHPVLAERFRHRLSKTARSDAETRLAAWFLDRLPEGDLDGRVSRWDTLDRESQGLVEWLAGLTPAQARRVAQLGYDYADTRGPYRTWLGVIEVGLRETPTDEEQSNLLWYQSNLARQAGELDLALQASRTKESLDRAAGRERERAVTLGKIADVLAARGDLDGALRFLREMALPAFEKLGDVRARAVTLGKIADVLMARGDLDGALRIRREEALPAFEKLGDVRERAVTLGKIADVLAARGDLDGALRIRQQEQLPVYEKLGLTRDLLVGRANTAVLLIQRRGPGDRAEARRLLDLALAAARQLRIPEAGQIERILAWLEEMG